MGWLLIICGALTTWAGVRRLDRKGDDWLFNTLFLGGLLLMLFGCGMMGGTVDPLWLLMIDER